MPLIHMYPFIITYGACPSRRTHVTTRITHSFNRSGRQQRRRGKKVTEGVVIGTTLHERWPTKLLQDGRGGARKVPLRGRCVSCYARAPVPLGKSKRKTKMHNGDSIPCVSFACNKCRVLLCQTCHDNIYDHRCGGVPHHILVVR